MGDVMRTIQQPSLAALVGQTAFMPDSDISESICLEIEGLSKSFGTFVALNSIDLTINEGEFVCFLGPSGCGKTTLLRAIAGLEPQSSGRIVQMGKEISHLPPQHRDFGIVFQSYALFPNLTLADNIAYGLRNQRHTRKAIQARVQELMSLIGLEGSEKKYPAQLSGGQQQRVALARALATEPGLLLLDEPLSALDAQVRVHLRQQIKALQKTLGVTTVMVTHDQEEALTMADRIVVMNHGVIEQVGTPEEVYRHPKSAFVAQFVGNMNFLSAEVCSPTAVMIGAQRYTTQPHALENKRPVHLAIRPEEVVLTSSGQAESQLEARVIHIEYLGAFLRLTCDVTSADIQLRVDIQHADAVQHQIQLGKDVHLALPAASCRVFRQDGN